MTTSYTRTPFVFGMTVVFVFGCAKKDQPTYLENSTQESQIGPGERTKPEETKPEETKASTDNSPVDLAKAKPDFMLTAEEWADQWKKDSNTAQKKYTGKVIELSGEVDSVAEDPYGKVGLVYIKARPGVSSVGCLLVDKEPWLKISKGSKVRVRGIKTKDQGYDEELYPCIVVEYTASAVRAVSAVQLAKEFNADLKAVSKDLDNETLIVEGEIVSKGAPKEGLAEFTIKGDGGTNIKCRWGVMTEFQRNRHESIKVGQRVKLCGIVDISGDKLSIRAVMMNPQAK